MIPQNPNDFCEPMRTLPKRFLPYPLSELENATVTDLDIADVVGPWLRQLRTVARLLQTAGLEEEFLDDRGAEYTATVGSFLETHLAALHAVLDAWYDGKDQQSSPLTREDVDRAGHGTYRHVPEEGGAQ